MKNTHKILLRSIIALLLLSAGAGRIMAYDHDSKGWIDSQHHHHPFVHHGGHRGYWDHDNNGARIFISI